MNHRDAFNASAKLKAWAVILFLAGVLLNHFPFVSLFNQPVSLLGIPLLIFYLHALWIGVIVGLLLLARAIQRTLSNGSEIKEP